MRAAAAAAAAAPAHQSAARVSQALMMAKRRLRLSSKRRSGAGPPASSRPAIRVRSLRGPSATPSNTEPAGSVFEGVAEGPRSDLTRMAGRLLAGGPAPLRRFELSLSRRFAIINACETRAADWWAGAAAAAAAAARKSLGASA